MTVLLSYRNLRPCLAPEAVADAAARALRLELALDPKPGLVSFTTNGSHEDMDAATFLASIEALRPHFVALAAAGAADADFDALKAIGVAAERDMLAATGGVNTHRGAVFSLGLLVAAAGRGGGTAPSSLAAVVRQRWGNAIRAADRTAAPSHGRRAALRYGVGGARAEAAAGFPVLTRTAWPAFARRRDEGHPAEAAAVEAFFATLATLDDTNLLHRGGGQGLAFAKASARRFLATGGIAADGWPRRAEAISAAFVHRRLSPGGAADVLAALLFLALLSAPGFRPWA